MTRTDGQPEDATDAPHPTRIELAVWSHDEAMRLAVKEEWTHGDTLQIRGMLSSTASVMASVLSPERMTEAEAELKKLVDHLSRDEVAFGLGDAYAGKTPGEMAVTAFDEILALRDTAADADDAAVERAMKAFALIAHDLTPEQYDAQRNRPMSSRQAAALEKSVSAMRAALAAAGRR